MNIIELIKSKKMEFVQADILGVIFLIFFLNIFLTLPPALFYVLIILVIGNVVFGVINKKRRIFMNIILLGLALLLFMFLVGYFATILGAAVTLAYLIVDCISFFRKDSGLKEAGQSSAQVSETKQKKVRVKSS